MYSYMDLNTVFMSTLSHTYAHTECLMCSCGDEKPLSSVWTHWHHPRPPATRPPPCPGAHFALSGAGRFPFQYKACLESNPPTSHCYKAKGKSCPFSALMISAVLVNQQVTQQQVVLEMLGASVYVYGAINIIYERESLSGA